MPGLHFEISADDKQFQQKMAAIQRIVRDTKQKAEQGGDELDKMLSNMSGGVAKLAAGLSAVAFAKKVATIRGEFQKLEVAFSTMLGNADKAAALMAQMTQLAATTPFSLQEVAAGAKQLLAYGTASEDVNDTLRRLGDVAAGLSIPLGDLIYLYGTTQTQGRLFAKDLYQFTGRGVPLTEELAKQFGVTKDKVSELVTEGKVGFNEIEKAIVSLTSEGGKFGGLMEAQSKTIAGQISNLKDNIEMMFNEIGKSNEGIINTSIQSVAYLVEHYEAVGRALMTLVATYGAYKAALITTNAIDTAKANALYEAEKAALTEVIGVKQVAINKDLEAAIASGKLTKAKAKEIVELHAEVAAKIKSAKATEAAAIKELQSNIAAHKAAIARRKEAKLNLALKQQELAQAERSGLIAQIINKRKKVETAELKLNTAATAENNAHKAVAAARAKQKAASTAAETLTTKANTLANTAEVQSLNLLTIAKTKLIAVTQKVIALAKANPYILMATAVAGLVTGLRQYGKYLGTVNTPTEQANKVLDKSAAAVANFDTELRQLYDTIKSDVAFEPIKQAAYDRLVQINPEIAKLYESYKDIAALSFDNLKDTMPTAEEIELANLKTERARIEQLRERTNLAMSEIPAGALSGFLTRQYQKEVKGYDEQLEIINNRISDITAKAEEATQLPGISASQELRETIAQIKAAEKAIADLRSGKAEIPAEKSASDLIKENEAARKAAEERYEALTGKKYGDKGYKEATKYATEAARKAAEMEYENHIQILQYQAEEAKEREFDLERYFTLQEQILDEEHQHAIDNIAAERDEKLKTAKGEDKASISAQYDAMMDAENKAHQQRVIRLNAERQLMQEGLLQQLADYQSYEQRRTAILKQYEAERKKARQVTDRQQREELLQGIDIRQREDLGALATDKFGRTSFMDAFIGKKGLVEMKKALQLILQLRKAVDDIRNNANADNTSVIENFAASFGLDPQSVADMVADGTEIINLTDDIGQSLDALYGNKSNTVFEGIANGIKALKDGIKNGNQQLVDFGQETLGQNLTGGAVMAADALGKLSVRLKEFADDTANEALSETAESMGAFAQNIQAAAQGAAQGGWIGAIVGGVTDLMSQITDTIFGEQQEIYEMQRNARDFQYEMEQSALRIKDIYSGVFGTNERQKMLDNLDLLQKAQKAYLEATGEELVVEEKKVFKSLGTAIFGLGFGGFEKELSNETLVQLDALKKGYNALQGMAVKTKDRSGFANFFGFQDEYTALADLAPELWNEKGDFNIENAKLFLETNTQITEEQRAQIQNIIDTADAYEEAKQGVLDYYISIFGSISDDLTDAITNAFATGEDALDNFTESFSSSAEKWLKDIIKLAYIQPYIDKAQKMVADAVETGGDVDAAMDDAMSLLFDNLDTMQSNSFAALDKYRREYERRYGVTIFDGSAQQQASQKGFGAMTQDTANELNGRFTALQMSGAQIAFDTAELNSIADDISAKMSAQLDRVYMIADYSEYSLTALRQIADNTALLVETNRRLARIDANTSKL